MIFSCKSNKIASDGSLDTTSSAKSIIKAHYQNELYFSTLSGKLKIAYTDGDDTQSVGVSFRMKKDEAIWMSAPFGVVKVYITPKRVSFYNKLGNEYFDGDFTYLSRLLGTELNFEKVQNVLLGQALVKFTRRKIHDEYCSRAVSIKAKKCSGII